MNCLKNKTKIDITKFVIIPTIVAIIFCLPLLSGDIYTGYDITFHLSRLSGIRSSISDLQFPISVYTNKNYGFGYASPLFYCDLFLILPTLLNYIGVDIRYIYILIVLIFNMAVCVTLLKLIYNRSNNYINSIVVLLSFEFSTLHILDTYWRSALGTITSWVFIMIVIYFLYKIFEDKQTSNVISICLGMAFAGILCCHNLSFFLMCFFFGLVCIFNFRNLNKEIIICILKAVLVAVLLSSFFLFPMLEQMIDGDFMYSHYTAWFKSNLTLKNIFNNFITSDLDIFTPGIIATITTIIALFKRKSISGLSYKLAIINIIFIFLSTDMSLLPYIEKLSFIQFPYRLSYIVICTSPFIFIDLIKNLTIPKTIIVVYVVLLSLNFYSACVLMYKDPEKVLYKDASVETLFGDNPKIRWQYPELLNAEYLPQTEDINYVTLNGCVMHSNLDDLECVFDRRGSKIEVTLNNEFDDIIMFPMSYYKGYSVYEIVNNKKIKLETESEKYYKLVSIYSPKGEHTYITEYKGTIVQKISLVVSLIAAISVMTYLIKSKKA